MKSKTVWNVIIWKANGDEEFRVFAQKPDFANIYPLINCNMIEFQKGYHKDYGTFEMHCDEESKLKSTFMKNSRATKAWQEYLKRTKRMSMPGDFIAGDVAILQKVKEPNEKKEVRSVA